VDLCVDGGWGMVRCGWAGKSTCTVRKGRLSWRIVSRLMRFFSFRLEDVL
jgi:hypothetical protein